MSAPQLSIDDAAFAGFHRRLALYSCGGPFCDGYILGIIAIALAPLSQAIGLTLTWQRLIAAATLAGMFIGGSVFGYVTDRVGRRVMYSLDLLLLVLASAAQFWVQDPWSLFALRFILGVAIGADPTLGAALTSLFVLAGVIPAILLVDRVGRRPLLTLPFAVTGATMVLLALVPKTAGILIALCFIVFAVFNAGSSVLQWIYPTELFPTEVRATALGFATAVSRIGAAAGTFLFLIGLHRLGVSNVMLIVGGICAVGWVLSLSSAPETRGLSLTEASRVTEHA
jgi:MFS family permease